MNKLNQFLTILIFFMLIISCGKKIEKEITIAKENNPIQTIHTVTYGTDPDAVKWFEYDEKGDILRQGMSVDTIVFEYSENKIVKRHLDKKLSWQSRVEYTTDQNGRITGSVSFDETDKEISRNDFFYDADGYLIKNQEVVLASGSKYTNEYMYSEGNLKEVKAFDMYGKYSSSYVFEYNADKTNRLNLFMEYIFDDIFPNDRLGKMNRNAISQISNISGEGDTLSLLKYSYTDEPNNAIIKILQSDVLNEFETEVIYHLSKK
ncbi:MAG: hypothetical protein IPM42_13575 [Saprospiraceae bacterium]|nr:hypothetical protein [Saprospiraceae bacterium]